MSSQYITQVPTLSPTSRVYATTIDTCNRTADATFLLNQNYCDYSPSESGVIYTRGRAFNLTNFDPSNTLSYIVSTAWRHGNGTVWPYNTDTVIYLQSPSTCSICACEDLNTVSNTGDYAVVVVALSPGQSELIIPSLPGYTDGPDGERRCGKVHIQITLSIGTVCPA
jgi:hypothetical protein